MPIRIWLGDITIGASFPQNGSSYCVVGHYTSGIELSANRITVVSAILASANQITVIAASANQITYYHLCNSGVNQSDYSRLAISAILIIF